jgi:undecaprenyl pyrophosphate phosphatase UppP
MYNNKRTLYERISAKLPDSKPSVIIGIILVIFGVLLVWLRSKDNDPNIQDVELYYVGSTLLVGIALVFV